MCVHTPRFHSTRKQQRLARAASWLALFNKLRSKESVTKLWRWGGSARASCCYSSKPFKVSHPHDHVVFQLAGGANHHTKGMALTHFLNITLLRRRSGLAFGAIYSAGTNPTVRLICRITGGGVRAKVQWLTGRRLCMGNLIAIKYVVEIYVEYNQHHMVKLMGDCIRASTVEPQQFKTNSKNVFPCWKDVSLMQISQIWYLF